MVPSCDLASGVDAETMVPDALSRVWRRPCRRRGDSSAT
jgi:hypothetical protein